MFVNRGFIANPVLLSTREHGKANEIYPEMDKFNYVITKVEIDNKFYLLDAANKHLGFGHLGEECYNGSGRTIDPIPVLVNLSPDSLKENSLTSVFIINGDKKMEGNLTANLGYFESEKLRNKLSNTKEEDYFKQIKKEYSSDVEILNTSIDSLQKLEDPVSIKYDINFNFGNDEDIIYFNPLLSDAIKENPFKPAQRLYPVERPYCIDDIYVLNMEIPKGYKVDELPKSTRVNLNEDEGMFEYIIAKTDNAVQMRCRLLLNKANFDPDDYTTLRDFYAFVVKKESEQIVFKKE